MAKSSRKPRNIGTRPDPAVAALAHNQHGYVTRCQLLALGLSSAAIGRRVSSGRLIAMHAGVYAVGHIPITPVSRAAAAVLACGPKAGLSDSSAAALWAMHGWPSGLIEVTTAVHRCRRGIRVHFRPALSARDFRTHFGVRTTSPARTILDNAPAWTPRKLRRAMADARHAGWLSPDALADVIARYPSHPGTRLVRAQLSDGPSGPNRSDWEDALPDFCRRHGLPIPLMNVRVGRYIVDALFVAERVILELDSWEFHQDRAAFERDRDRDLDTLLTGSITVRVTWERMTAGEAREAMRLRRLLAGRRAELD
ncbi:MAG: type IV toxin-antitoxin system AbiEi family antitoxin domain-containing protein [Solirubrobacteraceae bacterium]